MAKKKLGLVLLPGCRCRCGHEWLPRGEEKPRVCPKCKSPNWDRPKQFKRKQK
jgi:predicted Zn-ribbon and HTH transcriptional regulator